MRQNFTFCLISLCVSHYSLTVTIRQTNDNNAATYLSLIPFQRAWNSTYIHGWMKSFQKFKLFRGLKKKKKWCLVLSMTTSHIFQFIRQDFKGFRKTKCGRGFWSHRGACNSSIEVETWKSPKLESHCHRPSSCLHLWAECFFFGGERKFLIMSIEVFLLTHAMHGPLQTCWCILYVIYISSIDSEMCCNCAKLRQTKM